MEAEKRPTQTNSLTRISPGTTLVAVTIALFSVLVIVMVNKGVFNTGKLTLRMGDKGAIDMEVRGNELSLEKLVRKLSENKEDAELFQAVMKHSSYYKVTHLSKINDPSLVDEIQQLDYSDPVSERIRQLAEDFKGPFHYTSRVKFSVPGGNSIPVGKAAVCVNSPFYSSPSFKKYLFLSTKRAYQLGYSDQLVAVEASNYFRCPREEINKPNPNEKLVQISYVDAKRLFGDGPIRAIEDGHAEVVPPQGVVPLTN